MYIYIYIQYIYIYIYIQYIFACLYIYIYNAPLLLARIF